MKYIGVVVEKYSYMVEVDAVSWEDAEGFMSELDLRDLKPYHVDTEILKVGDA